MDTPETVEPSSPPILSLQPTTKAESPLASSSVKISPSPLTVSREAGLGTDAKFIIGVASIFYFFILLFCIQEAYYRITGRPRPRRRSAGAAGDRASSGAFGFGFIGSGGGGCGGGGC